MTLIALLLSIFEFLHNLFFTKANVLPNVIKNDRIQLSALLTTFKTRLNWQLTNLLLSCMELTNRFFRAPHTHRSAYSLCASGHRRVLEYSLSYLSSTRVTNYSVSAARRTGTVFMLGKTARCVTCCQGIAPLYSRSSTHLPFDVTGTAHALMVVMAVILVTMSSFSVVVDLVAFSTRSCYRCCYHYVPTKRREGRPIAASSVCLIRPITIKELKLFHQSWRNCSSCWDALAQLLRRVRKSRSQSL